MCSIIIITFYSIKKHIHHKQKVAHHHNHFHDKSLKQHSKRSIVRIRRPLQKNKLLNIVDSQVHITEFLLCPLVSFWQDIFCRTVVPSRRVLSRKNRPSSFFNIKLYVHKACNASSNCLTLFDRANTRGSTCTSS